MALSWAPSCTPFHSDIRNLVQRHRREGTSDRPSFAGVVLATSERIIERDRRGALRERFRGHDIEDFVELESRDEVVIFTRDKTHLVGR